MNVRDLLSRTRIRISYNYTRKTTSTYKASLQVRNRVSVFSLRIEQRSCHMYLCIWPPERPWRADGLMWLRLTRSYNASGLLLEMVTLMWLSKNVPKPSGRFSMKSAAPPRRAASRIRNSFSESCGSPMPIFSPRIAACYFPNLLNKNSSRLRYLSLIIISFDQQ